MGSEYAQRARRGRGGGLRAKAIVRVQLLVVVDARRGEGAGAQPLRPGLAPSALLLPSRLSCGRGVSRGDPRALGTNRRTVVCEERDAVCRAGGEDVNASMAAAGWAFAYRKYSRSYVAEEWAAKAANHPTL